MVNIRKAWFMLAKFRTDMRRWQEKGYSLAENLHGNKLGYYYFMFEEKRVASGKDQKLISQFDEHGIPISKTYIDVVDKDFVYFPITIGQLGLAVFHTYLQTNSKEDEKRFLRFVDWFYNNALESSELGAIWMTDVDLPAYKRKAPWQSAFSQSRAISILLRGFQLTGNTKYKMMAERALISFTVDVKDGGVRAQTEYGHFYEEYTAEKNTLVLNGKIFSLCGIYDFIRVDPSNSLAKKIFEEGVSTLTKILPSFDLGYWSRYNLCQAEWYPKIDPSTIGYQKLHVTQLELMYRLTNVELFSHFRDVFSSQLTLGNIIRMYRIKFKALKKIGRL